MIFFIGTLIIVCAAIAVVYKTLTGYTDFALPLKFCVLLFLILSWFAPIWIRLLRQGPAFLNGTFYDVAYKVGYFLMGFVLVLSMLLIARDIIWQILYFILRRPLLNPDNPHSINMCNIITLCFAFLISLYGVFEAHKTPAIKTLTITDKRVKENVKFVVASDFHINQSMPDWHIDKMVNVINAQKPDYILLAGDIIDDSPDRTMKKFERLQKLNAKKIYISLGNHEYYNKPYAWMIKFTDAGFEVLQNSGEKIDNSGIYVAGIPDTGSANVNYTRAFAHADDKDYKILLSHSPSDFKEADRSKFDLQLSGHTHGGQIFPFDYFTKKANDGYLKGLYTLDGTKLFVMKGAGYWGPPMRILAEPDILVLNLKKEKQ